MTEGSPVPTPLSIKRPRKGAKTGETGQRPWQDDPDILNRVKWIGSLTWAQGLSISQIARLLEVSEGTVAADRERYRTLGREEIKTGRDEHIRRLEMVIEEAIKAFHQLPANSVMARRADFLKVIDAAIMNKAKLDGSLDLKPQINIGIGISTGPSLRELWEQGKIQDADYEAGLRMAALQEHPIEGEYVALPSPSPSPLSEVVVPPATSTPASTPLTNGGNRSARPLSKPLATVEVVVETHGLAAFEEEPDPDEEDEDE